MSAVKPSVRLTAFWILGLALNLWAQSNWTVRRTGTPSLGAITWTGTQFVAVGGDSILSSLDGIVWTSRLSPVCCLEDLIWTGSQFVAVGGAIAGNSSMSPGYAVTSPDGVTWTQRNTGASIPLSSVAWTGSRLVAVGADGGAYVSPDGVTWAYKPVTEGESLHGITWTGHQLVAVGGSKIAVSDAIGSSWISQVKASGLYSVASGNGMHVAVGDTIISSSDGMTWTPRHSGVGAGLSEVVWTGNEFVAVGTGGGSGIVLTSSNGLAWTARNPGPSVGLHAVAVSNTQLVALGTNRSILTSPLEPVAILTSNNHLTFSIRLTSSHLFAEIPNALGTNPRVILYASSGRKITEVEINRAASEVEIPIGNLERGVYVLVMKSKGVSLQHRFSLTR